MGREVWIKKGEKVVKVIKDGRIYKAHFDPVLGVQKTKEIGKIVRR